MDYMSKVLEAIGKALVSKDTDILLLEMDNENLAERVAELEQELEASRRSVAPLHEHVF